MLAAMPSSSLPLQGLLIVVDLLLILVAFLTFMRSGIFYILIGALLLTVAIAEYRSLNVALERGNSNSSNSNCFLPPPLPSFQLETARLLAAFRRRHTATTCHLLNLGRCLLSASTAAFFALNLPFHAYSLLYLLFVGGQADRLFRLLLLVLLLAQTFIPLALALRMIAANQAVSSAVPHLLKAVQRVSPAKSAPGCLFFTERWKTASYIELLHRRTGRLELRAGTLGAFRRKNVLKVCV